MLLFLIVKIIMMKIYQIDMMKVYQIDMMNVYQIDSISSPMMIIENIESFWVIEF